MAKDTKVFTNLAGEFLVAAELNRRHILCSVTYGAAKSADVFAFDENSGRVLRIEVKSTDKVRGEWPVGTRGMKAGSSGHIWVFVLLPCTLEKKANDDCERGKHAPRSFVLTGPEVQRFAEELEDKYNRGYLGKHGVPPRPENRFPLIRLKEVVEHEAAWSKISMAMKG